jgi:hypothetical protein
MAYNSNLPAQVTDFTEFSLVTGAIFLISAKKLGMPLPDVGAK